MGRRRTNAVRRSGSGVWRLVVRPRAIPTTTNDAAAIEHDCNGADLRMAVHDAKIVGNNNVTVSARIHSFSGTCSGGSSSTPVLVGPTSTLTDANGVAGLALQMEVAGCTAGDVVVELYLPDYHEDENICRMRVKNGNAFVNANSSAIHRYALVQLYQQNPNLQYTSTVNLETTANPDNFTVITTASRVDIDSTVTSRTQNTFVNQTTWRYNDSAQTILDSVTSIPTTFTETSAPQPMLVVLQSPSNTTTMRRKMPITVQVLTEHDAIAGSEVSVLLMAPINTNAKLSGVQRLHGRHRHCNNGHPLSAAGLETIRYSLCRRLCSTRCSDRMVSRASSAHE